MIRGLEEAGAFSSMFIGKKEGVACVDGGVLAASALRPSKRTDLLVELGTREGERD
jgi:hypothetical protein